MRRPALLCALVAAVGLSVGLGFLLGASAAEAKGKAKRQAAGKSKGFSKAIWGPIKLRPGQAGCGTDSSTRCSAFPYYRELGVDVLQFQIKWSEVAKTRPANPRDPYDPAYWWSSDFDLAVQEAKQSGIKLAAMIKGSPPWANGGQDQHYAPNPGDYADFAYAAAKRFPSIDRWMVWGEPTRAFNFLPQGPAGARAYAGLLDAAYGELKRAGKSNIVIGGMTLSSGDTLPPVWVKNLRLPGGRRPRMDWYGHNPFEERAPRLKAGPTSAWWGQTRGLSDIDTLWREIKRAYRGQKAPSKLWLSEYTIETDDPSGAFDYYVSQEEQARRVQQSYDLAKKVPYVSGMGWWALSDYPVGENNPTWGLVTYEGAPKPSYAAYMQVR
jgi:hypothetical protein